MLRVVTSQAESPPWWNRIPLLFVIGGCVRVEGVGWGGGRVRLTLDDVPTYSGTKHHRPATSIVARGNNDMDIKD